MAAAVDAWRRISHEARTQCIALLIPFVEAADTVSVPQDASIPEMTTGTRPRVSVKDDWRAIIRSADRETTWAGVIAEIFLPPQWVDVVALAWGLARGWISRGKLRIQSAREQLYSSLSSVLQEVHHQFSSPSLAYGGLSPIDKELGSLERAMAGHIQAIAAQKSEQAQAELARIDEAARLDDQQRKVRAGLVQDQIVEWDGIGSSLKAIMADLQALDQASAPASALASGVEHVREGSKP
jgi:hypothetical protein